MTPPDCGVNEPAGISPIIPDGFDHHISIRVLDAESFIILESLTVAGVIKTQINLQPEIE